MGIFKKSSSSIGSGSPSRSKLSSGQLPRRASYPSGPWIDGIRPNEIEVENKNPNPANYNIIAAEEYGEYLIVKIKYLNCTNFEGNKILVFRGISFIDLVNQKLIDPHFFEDSKYASPIARFIPTKEGWEMAQKFCGIFVKKDEASVPLTSDGPICSLRGKVPFYEQAEEL